MARRAGVEVAGLDRLQRKLTALPPMYRRAVRIEVKSGLVNMQNGARRRARVRFGAMRNSITHETDSDGMGGVVGSNHGSSGKGNDILFHEFGTRKMSAQPMFVPAYEEERPRFLDRLERALDRAGKDAAAHR